jgi:hypothetical protein
MLRRFWAEGSKQPIGGITDLYESGPSPSLESCLQVSAA